MTAIAFATAAARFPRGEEKDRETAAPLLFIGLAATLYVIARIGLTYAVLGH